MAGILPGTVVQEVNTGKKGVTVNGSVSVCTEGDEVVPVVYEDEVNPVALFFDDLEVLGLENTEPNLQKCGAEGEERCVFLMFGRFGLECHKVSYLRNFLIQRNEESGGEKRVPIKLFPDCQLH